MSEDSEGVRRIVLRSSEFCLPERDRDPDLPARPSPSSPQPFVGGRDRTIGLSEPGIGSNEQVRPLNLLLDRPLCVEPGASRGFGQSVARGQASELLGWRARANDHHLEVVLMAGLEKQRNISNRQTGAGREVREPFANAAVDLWMNDRLQIGSSRAVREHEPAERRAIEACRQGGGTAAQNARPLAPDPRFQARPPHAPGGRRRRRGRPARQTARGSRTSRLRCRRSVPRGAWSHGDGPGGGGLGGVSEQHGNGEGADTPWHRSQRPGNLDDLRVDVSDDH